MDFFEIFLIGVALSMDAFAVSAAAHTPEKKSPRHALEIAASFGFFQMAMPIAGWWMGEAVYGLVSSFSKWAAFAILAAVGSKMIFDSLRGEESCMIMPLPFKTLCAIRCDEASTRSAVGVSFSLVDCPVLAPSAMIGATTFTLSLAGIFAGKALGESAGGKFAILGGAVLIGIGVKILLF